MKVGLTSVIIATHNRRELVERAIESTLQQKCVDLEVIVFDDASNDFTYDYLKKRYEGKIKIIRSEQNVGVAMASNLAFEHSSGEFIALLGDDDYWIDDEKIFQQVRLMSENPKIGVTGTWWFEEDENGMKCKTPIPPENRNKLLSWVLSSGGLICGSTPVISRESWEAVGGFDTRMKRGTDSDVFRRIILAGFDADIVKKKTTVVDTFGGRVRMTNAKGVAEARKHIYTNVYLICKYFPWYLRYPSALKIRLLAIVRGTYASLVR